MKKEHLDLIKKCQPRLIQAIVDSKCLEDLINELASQDQDGNYGLTSANIKKIREGTHTHEHDKVRIFLAVLCTRSEVVYDRFVKVIVDTNQAGLISILNSELPPEQQITPEVTTPAAATSVPSSSRKRRTTSHGDSKGVSNNLKNSRTRAIINEMPAEPITSPNSSTSFTGLRPIYTFGDHASSMVNAPVTGPVSFGDTLNNSQNTHNTITSHNDGLGMNLSGQITGNNHTFIQHYNAPSQASSTSSSFPSPSSTEDCQKKLETAQQSLREKYLTRFKKVYPFSLPFTFDIENTWVSLALKEEKKYSQATEDHAELLKRALEKEKMLIIEGDPATGKTSLMRRLAYEWAKGKQELLHYDFLLYAEFRDVREKTFESIADLVLGGLEGYLEGKDNEILGHSLKDYQFCRQNHILVLLDGYDESSLEKQCSELSSYLFESMLNKTLVFNVVITTRKGNLSHLHGLQGRFIFAEVLGFPTKKQKDKYISKHFLSTEIDYKENIAAVHRLLGENRNLNKIAATPLFLTFICLVHEKIVDGTLVELYCIIIWWLIDRYQKRNPNRDIPALFGFSNDSSHKFRTIQDHYLHFPQLHRVAEMALHNLEKDVFEHSDYQKFSLQPIIEQVGLLGKEEKHDESFKIVTSYFFPHRTIQEFLAAFYYFYSDDQTNSMPTNSKLVMSKMNEYQKFLLRISLSDKIPTSMVKHKAYFENLTDLRIDITFDAFNTATGFNNQRLDCLTSQCINMKNIEINGKLNCSTTNRNQKSNSASVSVPMKLIFRSFPSLLSATIRNCAFNMNSQLTISSCPSLKTIKFIACNTKSGTLTFAELLVFEAVIFEKCTFEASSQLSYKNCSSLKNLEFKQCEMKCSTILDIATLQAIDTVKFDRCTIDLTTWQLFTDQIRSSSVKYLEMRCGEDFNKEFLVHLQQCNNIEKMEITIEKYKIRHSELLSFSEMMNLHSLAFWDCTFEANSQLSFTNCPSLKKIQFFTCEIESSTNLGISALPAIDIVDFCHCTFKANSELSFTTSPPLKNVGISEYETQISANLGIATLPAIYILEFRGCKFDMAIWQSITYAISNSPVKCLKLSFGEDFNKEFLIHLQKCNNVEKIEFEIQDYTIRQTDQLSFSDLIKLRSLEFWKCTFKANSQLSFTNCPYLKNLEFYKGEIESNTHLGIKTLPAIDTVEFNQCKFDMATWQAITYQIGNSSVKCLKLTVDYFVERIYPGFIHHLQQCECIQQIHVKDYNDSDIDDCVLNRYEEEVTANLEQIAQKLPALTSITFLYEFGSRLNASRRLKERNKEQIEKAGQERNPAFSIK